MVGMFFVFADICDMGFDTLHRLPNACELYRITRECSRDLNLLVCGLIYWIATRRRTALLAMTRGMQFLEIRHRCHCECSDAIQ